MTCPAMKSSSAEVSSSRSNSRATWDFQALRMDRGCSRPRNDEVSLGCGQVGDLRHRWTEASRVPCEDVFSFEAPEGAFGEHDW